jgi:hypothetical protein
MRTRTRSTLAVALLALCAACSSIKNTPGGRPPDNAFCDQIDFGAGSVWVCAASPLLLDQQRQLAAKTKAAQVQQ